MIQIPATFLDEDGRVKVIVTTAGSVPSTAARFGGFAYNQTTYTLYIILT